MRLLTPAGFMPSFGEGQVRIVLCDDAGTRIAAPVHQGHHGKSDSPKHRQSCPYAAAAANPFLTSPDIALAHPLGPSSDLSESVLPVQTPVQRKIERPPSRAPPVLA